MVCIYLIINTLLNRGGIAEAITDCLKVIRQKFNDGYVVLMSESDYPVKSNAYIRDYLSKQQYDFIISTPLPNDNPMNIPCGSNWLEGGRRRYECYALRLKSKSIATIEPRKLNWGNFRQFVKVLRDNPRKLFKAVDILLRYPERRHPSYMPPCGGELWFVLRLQTIGKIIDFLQSHPDYIDYCKFTQVQDELFFPTLVNHLIPNAERKNTTLRYISWQANGSASPVDLTLGDEQLLKKCILAPDTLFVRKVQDMEVCALIDNLIED